MRNQIVLISFLTIAFLNCKRSAQIISSDVENESIQQDSLLSVEYDARGGNGALLSTKFESLVDLESVVRISYCNPDKSSAGIGSKHQMVVITNHGTNQTVTGILESGINEDDFLKAKSGSIWNKIGMAFRCPYAVFNRKDLKSIESLGRRRPWEFGKGDVAFYDLAEAMVKNIREEDTISMPAIDLSEKGYLNTFNHFTAQALMTSIFSEELADFVADVHERHNLPELVTGHFSEKQLNDLGEGPVDNYVDMVNNEWGQELGKTLSKKYSIQTHSAWTTELLADYLNDMEGYYSWAFQIGFKPFRETDEIVMRFSEKMNRVLGVEN
ncbi:MAG: hypothetical protein ABJC12_04495 [Saprospiraceae bacterium]